MQKEKDHAHKEEYGRARNLRHVTQYTMRSGQELGELQPRCAYSPQKWRHELWI